MKVCPLVSVNTEPATTCNADTNNDYGIISKVSNQSPCMQLQLRIAHTKYSNKTQNKG